MMPLRMMRIASTLLVIFSASVFAGSNCNEEPTTNCCYALSDSANSVLLTLAGETGHTSTVTSVVFSGDSSMLASASGDLKQ
jgi:WD40 repeat protein